MDPTTTQRTGALAAWRECRGDRGWAALSEHLRGQPCFVGLMSSPALATLVLWFPDEVAVLAWSTGVDQVLQVLEELRARYEVRGVAVDRWNGAGLAASLQAAGISVVLHGQGFLALSRAMTQLLGLIAGRSLSHGDDPRLASIAEAELVENGEGLLRPARDQGHGALTALLMAFNIAVAGEVESAPPFTAAQQARIRELIRETLIDVGQDMSDEVSRNVAKRAREALAK